MELFLFGMLGLLLVYMVVNTRRRTRLMREEQEKKRTGTVPGAKVLLQGGLYGTVVSYDHDDLAASAFVELAPGVVVEVHSQAVLRVVDPIEDEIEDDEDESGPVGIETPEETRARLKRDADDK